MNTARNRASQFRRRHRPLVILATGCCSLLLFCLSACGSSAGLAPTPGGETFGDSALPVGMRLYVGFSDLPVVGMGDVRLTEAHVTGVPSGLIVDKVGAVSIAETSAGSGGRHFIGAITEDMLAQGYPHLHIHPVTDAVLKPAGTADWYVVVVVEATRSGDFTTGGLHLSYRTAGGDAGEVEYHYRIHIHTSSGAP